MKKHTTVAIKQSLRAFFESDEMVLCVPVDTSVMSASETLHAAWERGGIRSAWNVFIYSITFYMASGPLKNFLLKSTGLKLGKNVFVAAGASIDLHFPQLVTIGDNVIIGTGAHIFTHEATHEHIRFGKVHIGDNALIGALATVRSGVCIGKNAVVGMHAMVLRDLNNDMMIVGEPMTDVHPVHRIAVSVQ